MHFGRSWVDRSKARLPRAFLPGVPVFSRQVSEGYWQPNGEWRPHREGSRLRKWSGSHAHLHSTPRMSDWKTLTHLTRFHDKARHWVWLGQIKWYHMCPRGCCMRTKTLRRAKVPMLIWSRYPVCIWTAKALPVNPFALKIFHQEMS